MLWKNRLQLCTEDAIYSDGDKYVPALSAVTYLRSFLPSAASVLVLGTGMGSMVQILRARGLQPQFTLVEYDRVILDTAMQMLGTDRIDPICADAQVFMQNNRQKFDFIFVDVFSGRQVPAFVTSLPFLRQCADALSSGGHIALNYIINDEEAWPGVINNFSRVFPSHHTVAISINRILFNKTAGI